MDYVKVPEARERPGLRLALTVGVPGPWSQSAKYLFEYKKIPFVPVAQLGTGDNPELFAWTGHRNAPVAVYENEPPRAGWYEILMLAERLAPEPALVPGSAAERAAMIGIMTEIASENGLAWQRRLQMVDVLKSHAKDDRVIRAADILAARYGYSAAAQDAAVVRIVDILEFLTATLKKQRDLGRDYFVGDGFTAADLYFACFSQLLSPLPHADNPMPRGLRQAYATAGDDVGAAIDPVLLAHRDMIYARHLSLPLEF